MAGRTHSMRKSVVIKEDGRRLIYYSFGGGKGEDGCPGPLKRETRPSQTCRSSGGTPYSKSG